MNWLLTPMTGVILAAAVIPPLVLLYFLKLRRRQSPIASTLLWQKSVEDMQANAPFQRLRKNLLLLLQLLVLILLAFAVMQPRIAAGQQRGGRVVLMIDNSASMAAIDTEDGVSRLDEAKDRAKEFVERMYAGGWMSDAPGETMVIAFSDRAEIMSRFTDSQTALLASIDLIQPTHGGSSLAEAFQLARAYNTNVDPEQAGRQIADPPVIELFSDGAIADLDEQVLKGETMNYHPIGTADAGNVAITAISVERPYERPTAVEVFVALENFSAEAVTDVSVQLSVSGTARGIETTNLPAATRDEESGVVSPGRSNVVFLPFEQPRDAVIEVAVLRDDALMADNVAQLVVPPPKQLRVALVEPKSRLIRLAMEGLSLKELVILSAAQLEQQAADEQLEQYDLVVIDDYAPQSLPRGRYLTFAQTPPVDGLNAFGTAKPQVILTTNDEHPAMRFVSMDNVFVQQGTLLQPADDVRILAEGSAGPTIVEVQRGGVSMIHVAFNPLDSNWPFQRSFVTFIYQAIDYLGHHGELLAIAGLRPGDALTARLPLGARDIRLDMPADQSATLSPADPAQTSWGPIRLAGTYLMSWEEPGEDERAQQAFAANILNPREGDISTRVSFKIGQDQLTATDSEATAYTPLWPWALGAALALLMFEWWVYHERLGM